jgi:hypothetical protein
MGRRANRLAGALVVTTRRFVIGVAVVLAALTAVVLVLALRGGNTAAVPRQAISGQTSLSRSAAMFADPVKASISLLIDRRRVDPERVGFNPSFKPYAVIGVPSVQRFDTGQLTHLKYTANLVCLTYECLPPGPNTRVQFKPAEVFYWRRSGGGPRKTLQLAWYPFTLASRTTEADLNNADPFQQPSWRITTDPLAVSYGISPGVLRGLLFALSGVLFLCALVGLVALFRAVRARIHRAPTTPLERAVMLVEEATQRDDQPAKRKALERLSRELTHTGEQDLALTARELAWAEPTPVPSVTQPLTVDVRRVIEERSNGHAR